ncbi:MULTISPECIES: beta-ketoacyl-ACP synthase III [Desulfococcus]|uniref:Beta-ketoacyl-[acyl-carrier-protein] synthase III n=1 Tax=Desulfococcus multivorans DSM 2059 TaxID=1121405 RepID=S7U4L7_DESML|nr:beta-ketoacyl-ACP synthase III [Desulfococcus multivorans]AOY57993.1 FabH1: 3-oxoacyl-[acyl-carrier-protein] synthase 3 [Desulfococcus multivorans]AQV00358.1 3-oxoacyl-ACP synthase [Desulfococcus multivorans]EPR44212.1 3-oxoacyl-(acyl-carrier-protein) synthase 3 [Desulfococcus multivorans DSM 2059]SJZ69837.1 3-oxoacyl-[acyl-carrier-protein] synthase III [Desulfococcus multivorans DSM 2059]
MRAIITGVGHFSPEKKLTNHELEKMVDTSDEWITIRTGIKERAVLDKEKGTSYMAVEAARMIFKHSRVLPEDIELIILATITPDMTVPSAAAIVQKELGANRSWGFDLNGGCTGFIYAIATASQFIETGRYKNALVIGADKMSSIINYEDRNTCVIFGDAAGAVLLERSEDNDLGIVDFDLHMDGIGVEYLNVLGGGSLHPATAETVRKRMHYVYQDGKTVFKYAVKGMTNVSEALLKRNGLTGNDLHHLIPHQANYRIIDAVAKKLGLTSEQVVINIEKYGNTTAATIPLAMSEAHQMHRFQKNDWMLLTAFGAGFTWGSVLLKWAI